MLGIMKFRQNPSSTHVLEEKCCVFLQPLPFYHYLYVEAHQNIEFSVDNQVLSSKTGLTADKFPPPQKTQAEICVLHVVDKRAVLK